MARAAGIDLGTTAPRRNLLRRPDEALAELTLSADKEPS
jgi:hypothetical protein